MMKKRIFRSMLILAFSVLLATMIILLGVLYGYFENREMDRLDIQLRTLSGDEEEIIGLGKAWRNSGYRITLIAADGTVEYDNKTNVLNMENHRSREEFLSAVENGYGRSKRWSDTISEKTLYSAKRLEDGSILRLSMEQKSIVGLVMGMIQPMLIAFLAAAILCLVFANSLSKRIISPLNQLDLENPLENKAYDELAPILGRLNRQQQLINEQIEDLSAQRQSFSFITDNLTEGLVLTDRHGKIMSLNKSAMELFDTDSSAIGRQLIALERNMEIQRLLENAIDSKGGEILHKKDGKTYLLRATPVSDDNKFGGICLLAVDITERIEAEFRRREFSANVSHELKTPLHSIMGASELLSNNLVKEEDKEGFIKRIHSEATKLVGLIDHIMRLARLDEQEAMPLEELKLKELALEATMALVNDAKLREVEVKVTGSEGKLKGVRTWLYEIIYNLVDNAIKYNKPKGNVDILITELVNEVSIVVTDTGEGIPREDIDRVFERFYRVDKSHGRDKGGTGLGLSIVKRATAYHGGELKIDSTVGEGTKVEIVFPKEKSTGMIG
ncbi:MAG: PAS domain-containing protein [Tissierellia bacterium]|nr:PAS domain-containing protein [Tissierellia bacterium]